MSAMVISFIACLALFALIGISSVSKAETTTEDYLLAGKNVPPFLAALSSAATNNSGFMFIGLIGFAWTDGIQAAWFHSGWVLGDIIAWWLIHPRIRRWSEETKALSVSSMLSMDRFGRTSRIIALLTAVLSIFFLTGYGAAQLKAGSTALYALLGWDMRIGTIIGAVIVVAYCFSGGLRASIWTDVAQAFVMLFAMAGIVIVSWMEVGNPMELAERLREIEPSLINLVPDSAAFGVVLYFLGFAFGGLGAIGQPHIVIRTMSMESPKHVKRARKWYFGWYLPFSLMAILAGLYSRVLLPNLMTDHADLAEPAELAMPLLAVDLLPGVLVGVVLAAVFAATMSTADSQLLSVSAALTQDIAPQYSESYMLSKVGTVTVTMLALVLALYADEGVFTLVLLAWSALGSTLGPLLIIRIFKQPLTDGVAVAMMVAGFATVVAWDQSPVLSGAIFRLMPGMLVPLLIYAFSWPWLRLRERRLESSEQ